MATAPYVQIPPLSTLLAQLSQSQITAQIIAQLEAAGLPASAWGQQTSLGAYFVNSESNVLTDLDQAIVNLGYGAYFQTAAIPALQYTATTAPTPAQIGTSGWVDLGAEEFFNLYRQPPVAVTGQFNVTATSSASASTVSPGQLVVTDGNGNTFVNTLSFTVVPSGSVQVTVQAQASGAQANIANGTTLSVVTGPAGISVTTYPSSGSPLWYASGQAGANIESDQSLINRCLNQWTSLSTGSPAGTWQNWCFSADPTVRYALTQATGLGGVNVTVSGNNGAGVSTQGLANISAYLGPRIPNCIYVATVQNAPTLAPAMTVVLYGPASAQTAATAAVQAALVLLIQSTPVGGNVLSLYTSGNGIANSQFVETITNASAQIAKTVVSVNNGSGLVAGADFLMPLSASVPVVAVVPSSFNISWTSIP